MHALQKTNNCLWTWSNENIRVEKGKWGKFYLIKGKIRKEISKSIDVDALTLDDAKQMLDNKKE